MTAQSLIIIGAGRSGTNILRDTLTQLPGFATWDCDEINLIWRHGNVDMTHDVFSLAQARLPVVRYLQAQFQSLARKSNGRVIVEKTCANSLRVPFLDAVVPDARYIHIVRDGRDVALSAAQRWTARVEPSYLFKKLRFVPTVDIPIYASRFVANRFHQALRSDKRQAVWGPIYPGMREDAKVLPLIEVCARQWAACVEQSTEAFAMMDPHKVVTIHYEDLVQAPDKVMQDICEWYEPGLSNQLPKRALEAIHSGSAKGWKRKIDRFTPASLDIMQEQLVRHGYETAT